MDLVEQLVTIWLSHIQSVEPEEIIVWAAIQELPYQEVRACLLELVARGRVRHLDSGAFQWLGN